MRSATVVALTVLATLSCGRELAQTAFREPTLADATSCETPLKSLPTAPTWVSSDEGARSVLLGGKYAGGEGPGLWLAARDAYRVYLNGALVAESEAARSADFIPLSLLPGDNTLTVAVWAAAGVPAALLQLDELDHSYVSDETWRVESAPQAGFASPRYRPEQDALASSLGRLGALPGCDPTAGFPADSLAHWIGPDMTAGSSAVFRRRIRLSPVGYGEATSGGGQEAPVVVTSWQELEALATEASTASTIVLPEGVYDFRRKGAEAEMRVACPSTCSGDPEKQRFTLLGSEETCAVETVLKAVDTRTLPLGSNKTLVGLGRGALLRGASVAIGKDAENVILRNVALYDVNRGLLGAGDGLTISGAKDVWIDHVTLKWISDDFMDARDDARGVTLSWMRYDGTSPDACRGQHTRAAQITDATVTLHHTFFDHAESHAPLVSGEQARAHIFDNLVQDNQGYGVGSSCAAQVLLEATTFRTVMTPTTRRDCADVPPVGAISAPEGSNLYLADVGKHAGIDAMEPHDAVFVPPYDYDEALEPPAQAWPRVLSRAGAGGAWPLPLSVEP